MQEPASHPSQRGAKHLPFTLGPDTDADGLPGASTSRPYTLHLYDANTSEPLPVNQGPIQSDILHNSRVGGKAQHSAEHQGWSSRELRQTAHTAQQPRGLASAQLQSRQLAPGSVQRENVAASLQLRTPARPNSAGSALRGYVPPEHRYILLLDPILFHKSLLLGISVQSC